MAEAMIGIVAHYFDKITVAAIALTDGSLSVGDTIRVKGHTTDLTVVVESIQVEHRSVMKAEKGESVGIKLGARAHVHDAVYKVTTD